jgi:hypothetical protein
MQNGDAPQRAWCNVCEKLASLLDVKGESEFHEKRISTLAKIKIISHAFSP